MKKMQRKLALLSLLIFTALCLCGCHGAKEQNAFLVPDEFDESKTYEITFWAKNDTNMTQVNIYKDTIA